MNSWSTRRLNPGSLDHGWRLGSSSEASPETEPGYFECTEKKRKGLDLTVETPNLEVLKRLDWKPAIGMGLESSHFSAHERGRRLLIASLTLSRIEGSGTLEAVPSLYLRAG